jgi:hypothetical protein
MGTVPMFHLTFIKVLKERSSTMKGDICLIRISKNKIVPALCLNTKGDHFYFAQIRIANEEDLFNLQSRATMERINRAKK